MTHDELVQQVVALTDPQAVADWKAIVRYYHSIGIPDDEIPEKAQDYFVRYADALKRTKEIISVIVTACAKIPDQKAGGFYQDVQGWLTPIDSEQKAKVCEEIAKEIRKLAARERVEPFC